jgi:nicotinate-nucleotide pyrophosphorylase (carboxylating)
MWLGQADAMAHDWHTSGVGTPPGEAVSEAVRRALVEDLMPLGDLTAALVDPEVITTAAFVARAAGVLAGRDCATQTFTAIDSSVVLEWRCRDGDAVVAGQVLAVARGPLHSVLTAERTALNFLSHLSGIASLTRRYVEAAAAGGPARIWDTRKTTPGLRALEKAAVRAGGGANHRGNLSDWVLIKDNHLAGASITDLVMRARHQWPGRTVHVECDHVIQVSEALAVGADALLLDNMSSDEVAYCVDLVGEHPGRRPLVEASGGITLDSVARYAAAGVDCISIGGLTNAAGVLDIGLDIGVDLGDADATSHP